MKSVKIGRVERVVKLICGRDKGIFTAVRKIALREVFKTVQRGGRARRGRTVGVGGGDAELVRFQSK